MVVGHLLVQENNVSSLNHLSTRCRYYSSLRLPLVYSHPYSQITVETEFDNPIYETGVRGPLFPATSLFVCCELVHIETKGFTSSCSPRRCQKGSEITAGEPGAFCELITSLSLYGFLAEGSQKERAAPETHGGTAEMGQSPPVAWGPSLVFPHVFLNPTPS